jgi:hypothetical protein
MSQLPDESAAGWRAPIRPSGARRLTLDMRVRIDQADAFTGLPHGTAKPLRFLAAFQEAEPYLGLPVHAYKLVAWLVKADTATGLGGRQPADRLALGAPPGGISRAVAGAREAAQPRPLRSRRLCHA